MAARYGGGFFALILPDTDWNGAACLAEHARYAVAQLQFRTQRPLRRILSASAPRASTTAGQLIAAADQALFQAKSLGRNRIESGRDDRKVRHFPLMPPIPQTTMNATRARSAAIAYVRGMNDAAPISAASAVPVYAPGPVPAVGGKVGVLLVNLGTPDGADAASVRRYLKEFLSDPRVIENQGLVWQLAFNGVMLRVRPRRKARDYARIWNQDKNKSPLREGSHPIAGREARRRAGAARAAAPG